jgi:hypothetical protein
MLCKIMFLSRAGDTNVSMCWTVYHIFNYRDFFAYLSSRRFLSNFFDFFSMANNCKQYHIHITDISIPNSRLTRLVHDYTAKSIVL